MFVMLKAGSRRGKGANPSPRCSCPSSSLFLLLDLQFFTMSTPSSVSPIDCALQSHPFANRPIHQRARNQLEQSGWEGWLIVVYSRLEGRSEFIHDCEWVFRDPTSSNISHQTFVTWTHFPNGTFIKRSFTRSCATTSSMRSTRMIVPPIRLMTITLLEHTLERFR